MRRIAIIGVIFCATPALAETKPKKFSPAPSANAGLMTTSKSIASGMTLAAKDMPSDIFSLQGAHSITSLRDNKSSATFDLGLGNATSKISSSGLAYTADQSLMHIGLGTKIVSMSGIRFGAHLEIADDPVKTKRTKPRASSSTTKVSAQDLSFFAAAGLTPNFGMGLNILMADRKIGDNQSPRR